MTCVTRRAVRLDAEAACEVVRRSIVDLCQSDHQGDSDTLAKWLANKTPANFERWIASEDHVAVAAEIDGVLVGFGLLNVRSTIELLYVAPSARFRGVSKSLLASLESEAVAVGIRELTLESSLTALPFYSRQGYTSSGPPVVGFGVLTCYPMSRLIVTAKGSPVDRAPSA